MIFDHDCLNKFISFIQENSLDTLASGIPEECHLDSLRHTFLCYHQEVDIIVDIIFMECDYTGNLLILIKLEEVLHIGTLSSLSTFRDFKCLYVVCFTFISYKCDVIVAGTNKEMIDVVSISKLCTDSSLSTLSDCFIFRSGKTLCKALLGDIDYNIFLLDEIFRRSIVKFLFYNDSSSFITILFADFPDFLLYNLKNMDSIGKDIVVFSDSLFDFLQFSQDFICFKVAQSSKLHIDDGIGLDLSEIKGLLQLQGSHSVICTVLYDFDYSIDIFQTLLQAKKNVFPFLGFLQIISCSSFNDFFSVVDIDHKHVFDIKELWSSVIKSKIVNIEVGLKGSTLPEHIQYYIWNCIGLQVNGDSKSIPSREILYHGDSRYDTILSVVIDLLYQLSLIHLIRKLRKVDGHMGLVHIIFTLGIRFGDLILTSDYNFSFTSRKGIHNASTAMNYTCRRKVRTLNYLR